MTSIIKNCEDKPCIEASVIMVSTGKTITEDSLIEFGGMIINGCRISVPDTGIDRFKEQHLFFTTDEKIKEGDVVLLPNNTIQKMSNSNMLDYSESESNATKKIVATTDKSLNIHWNLQDHKSFPNPNDNFIEKYISTQGKITKVLIEVEPDTYIFDCTVE